MDRTLPTSRTPSPRPSRHEVASWISTNALKEDQNKPPALKRREVHDSIEISYLEVAPPALQLHVVDGSVMQEQNTPVHSSTFTLQRVPRLPETSENENRGVFLHPRHLHRFPRNARFGPPGNFDRLVDPLKEASVISSKPLNDIVYIRDNFAKISETTRQKLVLSDFEEFDGAIDFTKAPSSFKLRMRSSTKTRC